MSRLELNNMCQLRGVLERKAVVAKATDDERCPIFTRARAPTPKPSTYEAGIVVSPSETGLLQPRWCKLEGNGPKDERAAMIAVL